MSVVFSGTNQGRFTQAATAVPVTIQLRSDVDWMQVINFTQVAAGANSTSFYWQRGMTQGRGLVTSQTGTVTQIATNAGFFLVDSSVNVPSAAVAVTNISAGAIPVVSGATAILGANLALGAVVRMASLVGALQLQGIDFTVDVINGGTFHLSYMAQVALAAAPGATAVYRRIPYNPMFYPRNRTITAITQAVQAVVTLSVTHGYTVGQVVRFVIPTLNATYFGMTELDGLTGTIVAVNTTTNTITVDIDSSAFTAFAFPLTTSPLGTYAQVVPVGANTAEGLLLGTDILADATLNTAYIGMQLQPGASSPGGAASDQMYWIAGKSFSVDNK